MAHRSRIPLWESFEIRRRGYWRPMRARTRQSCGSDANRRDRGIHAGGQPDRRRIQTLVAQEPVGRHRDRGGPSRDAHDHSGRLVRGHARRQASRSTCRDSRRDDHSDRRFGCRRCAQPLGKDGALLRSPRSTCAHELRSRRRAHRRARPRHLRQPSGDVGADHEAVVLLRQEPHGREGRRVRFPGDRLARVLEETGWRDDRHLDFGALGSDQPDRARTGGDVHRIVPLLAFRLCSRECARGAARGANRSG